MNNLITVSQFNKYIHDILAAEEILQNIEIYGEVSGLKISNGSAYFNIKDSDALLPCVKFGISALEYMPQEGEMIIVRGSPNYYIKGGRFSFNVSKWTPYGQGLLYQQFIELKNKLEKMGYFDTAIKKPLPEHIRRIGVVTSETGAVIHDIIDITRRRNKMIDIVLYPAKVQGIGAEDTIVSGVKALDKTDVDVIIVARGGGSLEDLSCFNTEKVAMAIYEAKKPVVSAVGHETDFTIADFVADVRAPTPSAAAELISSDISSVTNDFVLLIKRMERTVNNYFADAYNNLDTYSLLLQKHINLELTNNSQKLQTLATKFLRLSTERFNNIFNDFDLLTTKLESLNPIQIMKNGYSQVTFNNKTITDANQVNIGDVVDVYLHKGKIRCQIKDKEEK